MCAMNTELSTNMRNSPALEYTLVIVQVIAFPNNQLVDRNKTVPGYPILLEL